jgi:hypothetical protein
MKQEAFLIVGTSIVLTMAFFLGGRDKSYAQRLFTDASKEYKFISIEMAEQQTDSLTTNF